MEPRIQYAKTSDGVSIALCAMGEGPALVVLPNLAGTHLQRQFDMPGAKSFYERLSQRCRIICYDWRGTGMSQRDAIDFSVEASERDLQAVVDHLSLERFALYGHIIAGDLPFAYAAKHPERVSALVYWVGQTVRRSPEIMRRLRVIETLVDEEWDMYCDLRALVMFGWDSRAVPFAALLRDGHSPASFRKAGEELVRTLTPNGVMSEWASRVGVPALIMHLAGVEWPTDVARTLASSMPSAHVLAVPGHPATLMPYYYDSEVLTNAVSDFVEATSQDGAAPVAAPELKLSAMRAILWTDIEDHTAIMDRLGDAKGRDLLREHERLTREALAANGGTEVKAMGDGFMAWFPSAQQALDCAIAIQRAFALHNETAELLSVRVGVNAGEPIAEEDDLFGASVITAARICRHAAGGEIIASDVVRQLVAGKGFVFADKGAVALKGFEEPVRLFAVGWED